MAMTKQLEEPRDKKKNGTRFMAGQLRAPRHHRTIQPVPSSVSTAERLEEAVRKQEAAEVLHIDASCCKLQ
jgi:phospholipid N-methyltransferase